MLFVLSQTGLSYKESIFIPQFDAIVKFNQSVQTPEELGISIFSLFYTIYLVSGNLIAGLN